MSEQATTPLHARPTIADILVAHGFVSEQDLAGALEVSDRTGQPLGQVLVAAGTITRLELASALAEQWSDPESSITLLPRPAPQPPGVRVTPSEEPAGDDNDTHQGHLREAVTDLARRLSAAEPLLAELERRTADVDQEELATQIASLTARMDATTARLSDAEATLAATADQVEGLTEGVEQAFSSLQSGVGELAERLGVVASIVETAPTGGDLTELRTAVSELAARPVVDESLSARVDGVVADLAGALSAIDATSTAVDELAARTQDDGLRLERLGELERRVAELVDRPAVTSELEQRVHELAQRPQPDPTLPGRLDELAQQLDSASQRIGELGAHVESLAAVTSSGDDGVAIEELREALAELARRRSGDEETLELLGGLSDAVSELQSRPQGDPALALRLDELAAATASRAAHSDLAELAAAVEALAGRADAGEAALTEVGRQLGELAARPGDDTATAERLEELSAAVSNLAVDDSISALQAELEMIRARLESGETSLADLRETTAGLAERPPLAPDLEARLAALATRLDELAAQAAGATAGTEQVEVLAASLASLQTGVATSLTELGERIEALDSPAVPTGHVPVQDEAWTAAVAQLAERLDELSARLDERPPATSATASAPAPARRPAAAPAEPGDETEQELERLRMAIERMSLHLGEQERAIAEVMRSRGVTQRLDELEARIDDVASGAVAAGGGSGGGGTAGAAAAGPDVRALIRRLDAAEEALEAERDKLLTKLERIASSLDWRMRRLEAGDDAAA